MTAGTNLQTLIDSNPAFVRLVEQALARGVLSQDELEAACRPGWDAHAPTMSARLDDLVWSSAARDEAMTAAYEKRIADVSAAPRGTWFIELRRAGEQMYYAAVMADGFGGYHYRGDGWSAKPTFLSMLDRMVGMEIYRVRKHVETRKVALQNIATIRERRWTVRVALRNVKLDGETFSSALITSIDETSGSVGLTLTRRGSRHRWRATIGAAALAAGLEDEVAQPRNAKVETDSRQLALV